MPCVLGYCRGSVRRAAVMDCSFCAVRGLCAARGALTEKPRGAVLPWIEALWRSRDLCRVCWAIVEEARGVLLLRIAVFELFADFAPHAIAPGEERIGKATRRFSRSSKAAYGRVPGRNASRVPQFSSDKVRGDMIYYKRRELPVRFNEQNGAKRLGKVNQTEARQAAERAGYFFYHRAGYISGRAQRRYRRRVARAVRFRPAVGGGGGRFLCCICQF